MMTKRFIIIFLVLLSVNAYGQTLTAEYTRDGVWMNERGRKVLFYQAKTKSKDGKYPRANYVHPLYGLDGTELTEDFPEDHLHHRGIFWTWHQVIIGEKSIGDAWECRDFEWEVVKLDHHWGDEGQLSLRTTTFWKSSQWRNASGEEEPFLVEKTRISIHPTVKNYRIIDFEISLLALVPELKIGGSDDEKGYGGFSVRMKTPEDISFT
ncbi:MAG: PmoA family protein, partial [Bacteroidetes bacterium]|nr:PmoA family protein [Bacteroidota bacterium]